MVRRYGWYNEVIKKWQVGDREELNYKRMNNIPLTNLEVEFCKTKKASRKFEANILKRNKLNV